MTTMARCLEGHPFDTDVSATCPICGSTVWRDAVKEAAEKAAREAKEAKAAKEAKEAREAAERIEKAKEAKAAKDKAAREDAAARAAQSVRDALEAQAARRAAERVEEEEQRKLAVDVVVPPGSPESGVAAQVDSSPHADGAADSAAADEAGGAAAKARGAESKASLWVGLLVIFVGLPTLLFSAYLLVVSSQMAAVYRQFGKNQPENTTLENVMHTALLELRHGFQARLTDVPYGPNAGGFGRDGLVAVDPTGEPTRRVPLSAIRDAITRPTPVSPETSPRTMPNPFATPNR